MATIALSGTGTDKKVVLKTVDEVQKVSCSCCDPCASLPDQITVVISGVSKCSTSVCNAAIIPSGLFTLNKTEDSGIEWTSGGLTLICLNGVIALQLNYFSGADDFPMLADFYTIESGISSNIQPQLNNCDDIIVEDGVIFGHCLYGGTATLSWE